MGGWKVGSLIMLFAGLATPAKAQQTTAACVDLRPAIIAAAEVLKDRYVLPEEGGNGAASLIDTVRRRGEGRVCGDAEAQAAYLTRTVRSAIPDWHLRVAAGAPPPKQVVQGASPPAADYDDHGIVEVTRLAGGIGYLRISGFDDMAATESRLGHAVALLMGVSAVIIDVRGNRGGDGETMDLVLRSFLPADAPETFVKLNRAGTPVARTTPQPRSPKFPPTTKVVVLLDRASASAAEALAFGIREEGRGIVVGEHSLGASHEVDEAVSLPGGFALFIPEFRLAGRKTGRDWEGTGVVPDVEAQGPDALLLAWEQARWPSGKPAAR